MRRSIETLLREQVLENSKRNRSLGQQTFILSYKKHNAAKVVILCVITFQWPFHESFSRNQAFILHSVYFTDSAVNSFPPSEWFREPPASLHSLTPENVSSKDSIAILYFNQRQTESLSSLLKACKMGRKSKRRLFILRKGEKKLYLQK